MWRFLYGQGQTPPPENVENMACCGREQPPTWVTEISLKAQQYQDIKRKLREGKTRAGMGGEKVVNSHGDREHEAWAREKVGEGIGARIAEPAGVNSMCKPPESCGGAPGVRDCFNYADGEMGRGMA